VDRKLGNVIVKDANIVTKHVKPKSAQEKGQVGAARDACFRPSARCAGARLGG